MKLVSYFRALADGSRLRLLALMNRGPHCVEDLALALAVPQPKVSRHLAYLRRAGLVEGLRDGRRIFYAIVRPKEPFSRRLMNDLLRELDRQPPVRSDKRRLRVPRS